MSLIAFTLNGNEKGDAVGRNRESDGIGGAGRGKGRREVLNMGTLGVIVCCAKIPPGVEVSTSDAFFRGKD